MPTVPEPPPDGGLNLEEHSVTIIPQEEQQQQELAQDEDEEEDGVRHALVYGGNGVLGGRLVFDLKAAGWWVASVDYTANTHADINVLQMRDEDAGEQEVTLSAAIRSILGEAHQLDLIVCAGPSNDRDHIGGLQQPSYVQAGNEMWKAHVQPAMIAASVATQCLRKRGLLVFTSARDALKPCGDAIAVNVAKSAVLQFTKCMALAGSGLPPTATCLCLLPQPRKETCRHSDPGSIMAPGYFSELLINWMERKLETPPSGSVCDLVTNNFNTDCIVLS